ncbi:hypothetical protein LINPERPRIM_LOCUS12166 [Linum perenne]|jgi:hypothetical protein
MMV